MIRRHFRSFGLHVLTGFIAVAAHYSVLYGLLFLAVPPLGATSVGFLCGALVRFTLSYFHVFSPTQGVTAASWRFVLAIALQVSCNALLVKGAMLLGLSIWPAQILATGLLTFLNYLVYRWWVFR
ncbi:MAG: GtrA family protein [Burkholderiales bacterium]|jgi:putative flippase GtrA|nr:GtrA family protein [Burkholderiales bacterium]